MIDAAREHFEQRAEAAEHNLVRHEHMAGEPYRGPYWYLQDHGKDGNRTKLVQECRAELKEARRLVSFLRAAQLLWEEQTFNADADDVAALLKKLVP
jgi:hypothetical protein